MRHRPTAGVAALLLAGTVAGACAPIRTHAPEASRSTDRETVIARAQVWTATNIRAADLKAGPQGAGAFRFHQTVACAYVDKKLNGNSPKFSCRIGANDEVKVKIGGDNGEVYGEVLATRLLWALGFGADRMYPVNVVCRGCPETFGGIKQVHGEIRFDPAVVERKMPGKEWPSAGHSGWSWRELGLVDVQRGGAPRAQRDALTLLAVFLQHTDSKPEQQRILCLAPRSGESAACAHPFLMLNDVGLTFGRANLMNSNDKGGANLEAWRKTPVWKADAPCTGNLPRSFSGTLDNPVISEEGRMFLANLLLQLSDRQIRDLFEVAQVRLRLRSPGHVDSGLASVDDWVQAFKQKRSEIVQRRCA